MITVNEAEAKIISHTIRSDVEKVSLSRAAGRILRETIETDRPFPPFDRVALDGIAVRLTASCIPRETYAIQGILAAGDPPTKLLQEDGCIEVMTGAVLPIGTNCVIPYENLQIVRDDHSEETPRVAAIKEPRALRAFANVHRLGEDAGEGVCLVKKSTRVDCHVIGVAATVGKAQLMCSRLPRITIVSTGNELVDVHETPLLHQIRKSNVHSIAGAMAQHGFAVESLCHLQDEPQKMRFAIKHLLQKNDYLIFTGGVSKGRFDFVPEVLEQCGVTKVFHGIAQKPGKPMWFGKVLGGCLVFGLPGNPMSALVCLHRYVIPSLGIFSGLRDTFSTTWKVPANENFKRDRRTRFAPALLHTDVHGRLTAILKEHHGSGDLASLVGTHGFLEIPSEGERPSSWSFWGWEQGLVPSNHSPFPWQRSRVHVGVHA